MNLDPRESYQAKVLLGFTLVVVVVVALSGVLVTTLQDSVRADAREVTVGEADAIDDVVEATVSGLRRSAVTTERETVQVRGDDGFSKAERATLNRRYSQQTEFEEIEEVHFVAGDSGEVIASSTDSAVGASAAMLGFEVPFYLSPGETALRLNPGSETDEPSWVVYVGTTGGNVLVQSTPYSFIAGEIEGIQSETTVRLVDETGVVVYDSRGVDNVGEQHTNGSGVSSPAVANSQAGESGSLMVAAENSPTGEKLLIGYDDAIGSTRWATVSYAEPSALFATVQTVQRNVLLLLGGVVFALLGLLVVVERPAVREVSSLTDAVKRLSDGELDTAVETDRSDEFGDLGRGVDSMRRQLRDRIEEAERATAEAETAREEAETLSTHLETKAEEYRAGIQRLADGDFTARVDPESRHDGMQDIGETLNEVIAELEATVAEVQTFADDVSASMTTLSNSATEIESATAEVSETVQEISGGTDEQRDRVQSVVAEMNDVSATVEEIASTSGDVADSARRAAETSREGREAAQEASDALDEIETETAAAVEEVERLVDQVAEIQTFADVIGDVADQTDMLALNANVEAARSDGNSDGFAVVADEIKQLAEEAGDRAEDIDRLVTEVSEQTDATASRMESANDRIRESNETVQTAIDALTEIASAVEDTNNGVQDIDHATDDQAATTEEVTAAVEEVGDIAQRNASEASDAAAAAEQQTATVAEVARTAERVADQARQLEQTTAQFTVDPDATAADDDGEAADAVAGRVADGGDAPLVDD